MTETDRPQTVPAPAAEIAKRLHRDVVGLGGPRHRAIPGSLENARAYCRVELEAAGWHVKDQHFHRGPGLRVSDHGKPGGAVPVRWESGLDGVNLIASPSSTPPKPGCVLVIAHLDTVLTSPGADDNGSGVAVVLEVARQLAGQTHDVTLAIVDFEEANHLGSKHLAGVGPHPGLVVALDAVGYFDDSPKSQILPAAFGAIFPVAARRIRGNDRRGDFIMTMHRPSSLPFARDFGAAAGACGLPTVALEDRRWNGRGQGLTRWLYWLHFDLDRSDHEPFWRRSIPAVCLTGTATLRNRSYHRAGDTPERLDYDRMAKLALALTAALPKELAATAGAIGRRRHRRASGMRASRL